MTITLFHALFTIVLLIVFIGIVLWAYSSKRRKDFAEAARLPFDDDDKNSSGESR